MDDKGFLELEVCGMYGIIIKYDVEVISLYPTLVVRFVWFLHMVIYVHHVPSKCAE